MLKKTSLGNLFFIPYLMSSLSGCNPFYFLLFTFYFLSCQSNGDQRNIEAYYFPLSELREGKIYEYQSVGNEYDPPMYWYYKSIEQDGGEYLLGQAYGPDFTPDQFVREEKVGNGMMLVDFYTYESVDSTTNKVQVRANIEAGNVFPFFVQQPANVLLTSLSWEQVGMDGARINHIRNRQFDADAAYLFENKEVPAVKFNTIELVEYDKEGRLPLEFGGEEIYAKGIGLVSWKKNITEGYIMAYELTAIYDMEEFEEKFQMKLGE